jgi:hypothetical protein
MQNIVFPLILRGIYRLHRPHRLIAAILNAASIRYFRVHYVTIYSVKTVHGSTPATSNRQITLDEVKGWPPTIDVDEAALALGVSKGHIYNSIKRGQFPIKIIQIGSRTKIVTVSLLDHLEGLSQ